MPRALPPIEVAPLLFMVVHMEVTGSPVRQHAAALACEFKVGSYVRRRSPNHVCVCFIAPFHPAADNAAVAAGFELFDYLRKKNEGRARAAALRAETAAAAGRAPDRANLYQFRLLEPPDGFHSDAPQTIPAALVEHDEADDVPGLPVELRDTALEQIAEGHEIAGRMDDAVEILRTNDHARAAFQLAQGAIHFAQRRVRGVVSQHTLLLAE